MAHNRYFKKHQLVIICFTACIVTLLAVSKPLAQEISQYLNEDVLMTNQSELPNNAQLYPFSSNQNRVIHLYADEFDFQSHLEFPSSVKTNPVKYAESITQDNQGAIDIILINEGNTTKYLFKVTSIPKQQCTSDATSSCQPRTAIQPARGNVADIQVVLSGSKLLPGTYSFGKDQAIPVEDFMINSRQLYSDSSHGKLGCQTWGVGAIAVKKAIYNVNDKLEYLEVSLFRVCEETAPFPPTLSQDNVLQAEVENIKKYTYHASWRCHLKVVAEGSL
ncbi:hypothetical protein [Anabaena azotica]|uniref:Uncharacterized protein n=1 Tax=Anabaena azotica FACHB-119 TaxID=947527 RepID=A0ABR8D9X8_9NOST|nr:hypothetical protein [Anabaena azotica]MBD2503727.1 hypothetical protein [Anabaena azotica FACHB-119]